MPHFKVECRSLVCYVSVCMGGGGVACMVPSSFSDAEPPSSLAFAAMSASPDCRQRPGGRPGRACACGGAAYPGESCAAGTCAVVEGASFAVAAAADSSPACPTAQSAGSCASCVRAVRIGAQNREGGSCGGGFRAGGGGGAGRLTAASLPPVAIATPGAVGAAAVAVSSAPLWRGCDQSARWSAETARARRAGRGNGRTGIAAWTFACAASYADLVSLPKCGHLGMRAPRVQRRARA